MTGGVLSLSILRPEMLNGLRIAVISTPSMLVIHHLLSALLPLLLTDEFFLFRLSLFPFFVGDPGHDLFVSLCFFLSIVHLTLLLISIPLLNVLVSLL